MPDDANDRPATHAELRAGLAEVRTGLRAEITAEITASETRLTEVMRDVQSEILRSLEAFARGNFARLHRLETSHADTNARLTALEERILYLETRRLPAA